MSSETSRRKDPQPTRVAGPSRGAPTVAEGRAVASADVASGRKRSEASGPWERYGWLMAAVWLVFLFYPILALVTRPVSDGAKALGWFGLAAFVYLYLSGFQRGMRRGGGVSGGRIPTAQWWTFAGMIGCALLTAPAVGGNVLSFTPYIVSFASYGLNRVMHWVTSAACVAAVVVCIFALPDGINFLSVGVILLVLICVNTVSTWLIRRSAEADELAKELATSEERESIARDVHDLIGHSLTVVKLKAELAQRLVDRDPERAKKELGEIAEITSEALSGVRATVSGLRSEGLAPQWEEAVSVLEDAGITVETQGDPLALSTAQSIPAAWILRESVTNVLRHAHAQRVRIAAAPGRLEVDDDGVGLRAKAGNGVRGMRERAAASGASCVVEESPWGGTRVSVTW